MSGVNKISRAFRLLIHDEITPDNILKIYRDNGPINIFELTDSPLINPERKMQIIETAMALLTKEYLKHEGPAMNISLKGKMHLIVTHKSINFIATILAIAALLLTVISLRQGCR